MRVSISVLGRFHAFYLAHQLHRRGHLDRLITSYPRFETNKYGLEGAPVDSLLINEIANRAWNRSPRWFKARYNAQYMMSELFDRRAARHVPRSTELFVGWSSTSLHTLRRARDQGAKLVIERGSSHIATQAALLQDEYERLGLRCLELPHPRIIDKELAEYEEADVISIPSKFVKQTFIERGIAEQKLLHIPYGVDLDSFHPPAQREKAFRVIHCGAISIRKGVHYLLQAFAELNLRDAELWLIGHVTDEMKPFLARYATPRVQHLGPFPERELRRYYAQGSVFCLSSIEDGFGMVLIQAMACGMPVIATTNTGASDVVRDGVEGFIIPIRDVGVLKEKILFAYEHREARENMGAAAAERVRRAFTWNDYGEAMVAAYERILRS
jgi:glycosyltransferase involved in cell wall biosynthesis